MAAHATPFPFAIQETLLKCYFTLGKTEDVKSLRDAPHVHLEHLQKSLAQYDEEVQ